MLGIYIGYTTLNKKENIKYVNDTVTITKIDSFRIIQPRPYAVIKHSIVKDTLYSTDSIPVPVEVQIPISKYNFKDTAICDADSIFIEQNILGYGVKVESITARLKMSHKVIIPVKIIKDKRFSIGPYVGASIYNNKIIPSFGISIQYSLFKF